LIWGGYKVKSFKHYLGTIFQIAILLITFCAAHTASAGTLSTAVIGMFPKDIGEFAYADLKASQKFPWFPQLREQLLPSRFRDFEKFMASAGIDPNTQVEEIAWAGITDSKAGGEEIVGAALGSFDPSSAEAKFKAQKMAMVDVHGYHLYSSGSASGGGSIYFTFIDSNTAAFGNRSSLEKLIDVRVGTSESLLTNDKLFPLITSVNGSGIIWAVLDQNYTHLGMTQLVPQASQFPQATKIIERLQAMTISVVADTNVDAKFEAVCSSPDDANLLGAALQAGVMYQRYQQTQAQANSTLANALQNIRVTPSGDHLKIDLPISQDQLQSLIASKAFAVPL
jgi:hypothetical protein